MGGLIGRTVTPIPQPIVTHRVHGSRLGHASHASKYLHSGTKRTKCHLHTKRARNEEKTGAGMRRTGLPDHHSQEAECGENRVASPDIDALKACKCR